MRLPEADVLVQDHGNFVSARFPDGETQTLSWSELERFEIQTLDTAPFGWDVWFHLVGFRDTVSIPLGATGYQDILEAASKVTGKPRSELITGMNCTEDRTLVTWEKGADR